MAFFFFFPVSQFWNTKVSQARAKDAMGCFFSCFWGKVHLQYNVLVRIRKLTDGSEGWPVWLSPVFFGRLGPIRQGLDLVEALNRAFATKSILSVAGLSGCGKSFVLGKLSEVSLPPETPKGIAFASSPPIFPLGGRMATVRQCGEQSAPRRGIPPATLS